MGPSVGLVVSCNQPHTITAPLQRVSGEQVNGVRVHPGPEMRRMSLRLTDELNFFSLGGLGVLRAERAGLDEAEKFLSHIFYPLCLAPVL